MRCALVIGVGVVIGFGVMVYALGKYGEKVCDHIEQKWRFV